MSGLLLQNHDRHDLLLDYDPATGRATRRRRSELASPVTAPGFWIEHDGKVVGVCPSPRGPILFHGDEQLLVEKGRTRMTVQKAGKERVFEVRQDGEVWMKARYEPPGPDPMGWGDEDFSDFFAWLADDTDQLITFLTR